MCPRSTSLAGNIALLAALSCISACAGNEPRVRDVTADLPVASPRPGVSTAPAIAHRPLHERAAVSAVRQVGTPYVYGGADEDGFDCSGLVYFAYQQAGKHLPRTTRTLWKSLRPVAPPDLRVGDVLFFRIAGKVSHVGLYLGGRRFVHAPQSGRHVTVAGLDSPYYRKAFVRAGRP